MIRVFYLILPLLSFVSGWMITHYELSDRTRYDENKPDEVRGSPAVAAHAEVGPTRADSVNAKEAVAKDDAEPVDDAYIESLQIIPLDHSMALSGDLVQALGLNDAKVQEVNRLIADLMSEIERLEMIHREVTDPGTLDMVVVVKPFREEGQRLWKDTERRVNEIIGSEGSRILWHQGAEMLRKRLRNFGHDEQRTVLTPKEGGGYEAMHWTKGRVQHIFTGIGNEIDEKLIHLYMEDSNGE